VGKRTELFYLSKNKEISNIYWMPIIAKYYVIASDLSEFQSCLQVRTSISESYKITLNGLISLRFDEYCCIRCGLKRTENYGRICSNCKTREEQAFETCLYHSPHSIYENFCTKEESACEIQDNVPKCFCNYYLYFGRFGEMIKVVTISIST